MAIVYIATNKINGKRYIGATSKTLEHRRSGHINHANSKKKKVKFHSAILKYGKDAFEWKILAEFPTFNDALAAEIKFITDFLPEYNQTAGGEGALGYKHTAEALKKMSQNSKGKIGFWRGKKRSAETIRKISEANKKNPPRIWLGKKRSLETIEKIRQKKLGVKRPILADNIVEIFRNNMRRAAANRRKKIRCLNDNREFISAKEVAEFYNLKTLSINAVAAGKRNSLNGLIFKYV